MGGCCYSLKHRYDEAITNFEAAINLDPTLARAYYNLARCYYNKGELNKTLELYNKSIRLDPAHANSYGGRARTTQTVKAPQKPVAPKAVNPSQQMAASQRIKSTGFLL